MANAIVGSAQIVGLAALIGIPIGFSQACTCPNIEDKRFAS